MSYKDASKDEHDRRCAAIVAHLKIAVDTQDRLMAEAANHLARFLDDRRKVSWSRHPMYIAADLPRYCERRFGEFAVDFTSYSGDGMQFYVDRVSPPKVDGGEDTHETIATIPVLAYFNPLKTKHAFDEAEHRAVLIAKMLDANVGGNGEETKS